MKFNKWSVAIIFSAAVFSLGCGKKKENNVDADSIRYYSQFLTDIDGAPTGEELNVTCVQRTVYSGYGNSNAQAQGQCYMSSNSDGSSSLKLKFSSDGTFFLYYNNDQINNFFNVGNRQNITYEGIAGNWNIERDRLILDKVGSSINRDSVQVVANNFSGQNNYLNQYQDYEYSDKCFTIEVSSELNLDQNNAYSNGYVNQSSITAGSVIKVCK